MCLNYYATVTALLDSSPKMHWRYRFKPWKRFIRVYSFWAVS